MPLVLSDIVDLTRLRAISAMPRSHDDNISIEPLSDAMGVPLVVHVTPRCEAHRRLIEDACLLEVNFGVGDGPACHVDASADLD